MASDLNADMIHLLVRGLMVLVDQTPEHDANNVLLLQQCKETLEWLQTEALQIDNRPETAEMFSAWIGIISQKLDLANEHTGAKSVNRAHEPKQIEPFNLGNLLTAWDRNLLGGSAAVLATLEEIMSNVDTRK